MQVILNSPGYSYDVHSLVKAFYPGMNVSVTTDANDHKSSGCMSVFVSSGDIGKDMKVSGIVRITVPSEDSVITREGSYADATRADVKNLLKRLIYEALSEKTGMSLPWGTMTGIRPTKVPMKMLCEGSSESGIADYMKSVYLCSDEKIRLATDIAKREMKVTKSLSKDGFCLYIGIPFCPTRCLYCSFTSYPITSWNERTADYIAALKKELDFFSDYY